MTNASKLVLVVVFISSTLLIAQDHVELGVFGNYNRQSIPGAAEHLFGLGGRADFNLAPTLQLELEMAYDFKRSQFNLSQQSSTVILNNNQMGILHANAGFKVQTRGGSFFAFLKGGMNQYQFSSTTSAVTGFPINLNTIERPDNSYAKGILYPGAGIGFHAGLLGIRLDVGDEIHWLNGDTKHSLRVTFGPTFRF